MRVLDRFEIKRRGTVITVPYPGGPVPARELHGHYVYRVSDLHTWKIVGVETFAKLAPPEPGDAIGLCLAWDSVYPDVNDFLSFV